MHEFKPIKLPNIFLWAAFFADGTSIWQDATDISRTYTPVDENDEGKNQFWDVLQKQKEVPLQSFCFYRPETNPETGETAVVSQWAVDLQDGHFEHNRVPFWLHRPEHDEQYRDFRLIQYRHVVQALDRRSGSAEGYIEAYILGWQTNDEEGNNVQRIVKIVA